MVGQARDVCSAPGLSTLTGKVRVEEDRYALIEADGTEIDYDAYVGADGLHVGWRCQKQLRPDRQGTVDIEPNEQLEVGDGTCRYTAPDLKHAISAGCSFVRRSGRTVLLYKAPDPLHGGKTAVTGLVYLPRYRLVVSPESERVPHPHEGVSGRPGFAANRAR